MTRQNYARLKHQAPSPIVVVMYCRGHPVTSLFDGIDQREQVDKARGVHRKHKHSIAER